MFVKTKELQLIIKGQYINNSSFVKPTLNLHTYEIQFLMLVYVMIFLNTTFTQDDSVQRCFVHVCEVIFGPYTPNTMKYLKVHMLMVKEKNTSVFVGVKLRL
jgi:hypothetical protein